MFIPAMFGRGLPSSPSQQATKGNAPSPGSETFGTQFNNKYNKVLLLILHVLAPELLTHFLHLPFFALFSCFFFFCRRVDAVRFPAKKLSAARLEAQLIYMTISRNVAQLLYREKKTTKKLCLF